MFESDLTWVTRSVIKVNAYRLVTLVKWLTFQQCQTWRNRWNIALTIDKTVVWWCILFICLHPHNLYVNIRYEPLPVVMNPPRFQEFRTRFITRHPIGNSSPHHTDKGLADLSMHQCVNRTSLVSALCAATPVHPHCVRYAPLRLPWESKSTARAGDDYGST